MHVFIESSKESEILSAIVIAKSYPFVKKLMEEVPYYAKKPKDNLLGFEIVNNGCRCPP